MATTVGREPLEKDALPAGLPQKIRLVLFAAIALIGIVLMLTPLVKAKFLLFSPFWFYGLILALAASLGAAADHFGFSRTAIAVVTFLLVDLALGGVSRVTSALKLTTNLLPESKRSMLGATGFQRHPLLQIRMTPGYNSGGYTHTKFATRAVVEPKTGPARRMNVSLIGGSSTYDIDRPQGETWPDRLQEKLTNFRFWNWGVPSYTTIAHVVQTAWYLPEVDTQCAIYYIGWNDVRNNNLPNIDPAFAEYHLPDLAKYARELTDNAPMPSLRMLWLLDGLVGGERVPPYYATVRPKPGSDARFEGYYRQNVETLISINRARGVKVGFIGQLLNYPLLAAQPAGQRAFGAPGVQDRDIPAAMDHLNGVLAQTAAAHSIPYLAPAQDWLKADDYTDFGHFAEPGARKFAERVADFIDRTCSGK